MSRTTYARPVASVTTATRRSDSYSGASGCWIMVSNKIWNHWIKKICKHWFKKICKSLVSKVWIIDEKDRNTVSCNGAREQGREQNEIEEYEYSTPYITPFFTVFGGCFWRLFLVFLEAVFGWLFLEGCFWMAVVGGAYRTSNARRPRFPRAHATRRRILCATHRALWCTNRLCLRRNVQWCTCEKRSVSRG